MIVYKYRTFEDRFHLQMLFNQELYFSHPESFNDPFDCFILPQIPDLSNPTIQESLAYDITSGHYPIEKVGFKEFTQRKNQLKEKFKNSDEFIEGLIKQIRSLNRYVGVFCSSFNWNNILQWSYYGGSHTGFTVGLDLRKIYDLKYVSYASLVHYYEYPKIELPKYFPSINSNSTDHFKEVSYFLYFNKFSKWIHEEEFRLVKSFHGNPNHSRVLNFSIGAITDITVGHNIDLTNLNKIITFCHKYKIPLYLTNMKYGEYTLGRNRYL